jgi:hypothetical protein
LQRTTTDTQNGVRFRRRGRRWQGLVRLEAGAGSLAGFELAVEDEGGIGEFFRREAEGGAKEDLGKPAPGQGHEAHAFLEVAVAGQEFESLLDESLRIEPRSLSPRPISSAMRDSLREFAVQGEPP